MFFSPQVKRWAIVTYKHGISNFAPNPTNESGEHTATDPPDKE